MNRPRRPPSPALLLAARPAPGPLASCVAFLLLALLAAGCNGPAPVAGTAPPAGNAAPATDGSQAAGAAASNAAGTAPTGTAAVQPAAPAPPSAPSAGAAAPSAGAAPAGTQDARAAAPGTPVAAAGAVRSLQTLLAGSAAPPQPAPPPGTATDATGTGTLEPVHAVAPPTAAELARKREEWAEHERMAQQQEQNLQEWRRLRAPDSATAARVPRVGAAPTPPAPPDDREAAQAAVREWYAGYRLRAHAVTQALSRYGLATAEQPPDEARLTSACRELDRTAAALLADPRALAAPSEAISHLLATAYGEIQATADACLATRPDLQASHFAAARRALTEAAAAMRPLGLAP